MGECITLNHDAVTVTVRPATLGGVTPILQFVMALNMGYVITAVNVFYFSLRARATRARKLLAFGLLIPEP